MEIKRGDKVLYKSEVVEVYSVTVDDGLILEKFGNVCGSKVELLKTDLTVSLAQYAESQEKVKRFDFYSDGDKRTVLAFHYEDQTGFDFFDEEENLTGSFLVDPQSRKGYLAFMTAHLKR